MVCKYWHEYDDEIGLYEYCSKKRRRCICSGDEKQCNFKEIENSEG